jgi:phage baseplate assembly protein W
LARTEFRYNPIDLIPDKAVGIKLPFTGKKGLFDLSYTTEEQALSNLKNLVLTRKGERLMHPNFGTSIYDVLFENMSDDFLIDVEDRLRDDIEFWLPYLIIDEISANQLAPGQARDFENGFSVLIRVRVTENGANRTIVLNLGNGVANVIDIVTGLG